MAEFRYTALNLDDRVVRGVISARRSREASALIQELCQHNQLRWVRTERKRTFLYTVQVGQERPRQSEQRAFSREEIIQALEKMDYRVLKVQRKWIDTRVRPPFSDIVLFIRITADLLREGLSYNEILPLLASDVSSRTLREVIREINQDLKDGREGQEVFAKHQDILGRFPAYMLGVASTSGDMTAIYDSTAKFLERNEEFRKSLRQALIVPLVVAFFLLLAVLFYVGYIFPKTAELFVKFGMELPPLTRGTLALSGFLKDHILLELAGLAALVGGITHFVRSVRGREWIDRLLPRLPVVGPLMHKTSIEIFARVFHSLYTGSGENITVLRIAAEACRNTWMERRIKEVAIPSMLRQGQGLVEALEQTQVFTRNALSRFRAGVESGNLKMAALQLANYYERETTYRLRHVVDLINFSLSLTIALVMILLTLISSETAVIRPPNPMLQQ